MLVPELAHNQTGEIKRKWKNYYKERKSIDNQQKDATLDCPTEIRLDILLKKVKISSSMPWP